MGASPLPRADSLVNSPFLDVPSASFDRGRGNLNVRNNVPNRTAPIKLRGHVAELIIKDYVVDIRQAKPNNVSILRNECLLSIND